MKNAANIKWYGEDVPPLYPCSKSGSFIPVSERIVGETTKHWLSGEKWLYEKWPKTKYTLAAQEQHDQQMRILRELARLIGY